MLGFRFDGCSGGEDVLDALLEAMSINRLTELRYFFYLCYYLIHLHIFQS